MSEMQERVAKALRDELQRIGYGIGTINAGQLSDALARAAINAMREPSEGMLSTACAADAYDMGEYGIKMLYQIMIDSALTETPEQEDAA